MSQIVKPFRPSGLIRLRRLFSDERATSRLDDYRSGSCQRIVSMPNRVQINPKSNRHLPHGRHLFTRFKDARADSPEQLIPDLHIDRNTGSLDVKSV
jgi:hypothetical protein